MTLSRSAPGLLMLACAMVCAGLLLWRRATPGPALSFQGETNGMWSFSLTNGTREVFSVSELEHLSHPTVLWPHSAIGLGIVEIAWSTNRTVGFWCVPAKNRILSALRFAWASSKLSAWLRGSLGYAVWLFSRWRMDLRSGATRPAKT